MKQKINNIRTVDKFESMDLVETLKSILKDDATQWYVVSKHGIVEKND